MAHSKKILGHTADLRMKLRAETLPGLFEMALEGLNQLLTGGPVKKSAVQELTDRIELESPDTTALLIDFLSEVLTLSQVNKAVYFELEIEKMTDCRLSGMIHGYPVDGFEEDVKAVTYHEAEVRVNEEGDWETVIIFDI